MTVSGSTAAAQSDASMSLPSIGPGGEHPPALLLTAPRKYSFPRRRATRPAGFYKLVVAKRAWGSVNGCEDGQALVELALILPFLLLIALGVANFGHALDLKDQETSAARTGARYASTNSRPDGQKINTWLPASIGNPDLRSHVTVEVSFPDTGAQNHCVGKPVRFRLVWNDYPLMPALTNLMGDFGAHVGTVTLASAVTMRLEANWDGNAVTGQGSPSDGFDAVPGSATADSC